MKLEMSILAGAETKQFLVNLTQLVERMEKAAGGKVTAPTRTTATASRPDDEEEDDADDFAPTNPKKTTGGKAGTMSRAAFEDDGEEEDAEPIEAAKIRKGATTKKASTSFDDAGEEEEEEITPPKAAKGKATTKPPKLTADDVNEACLARAGETSRKEVLGILAKQFKVKSITDLEPSQYADVIEAMKAE